VLVYHQYNIAPELIAISNQHAAKSHSSSAALPAAADTGCTRFHHEVMRTGRTTIRRVSPSIMLA